MQYCGAARCRDERFAAFSTSVEGVPGWWERQEQRLLDAFGRWSARYPRAGAAVLLVVRTAKTTARIRVVGLSAEAAFFSMLSLPAMLLGIIGTLGHLAPVLGETTVRQIRERILELALALLAPDTINSVVEPLVDDFLRGTQGGILSVTFLVSLWSGSRAMKVFILSIAFSYGLDKMRGYIRQRITAFAVYLGGLLFALVVLPLLVVGPNTIRSLLPAMGSYLSLAYWPVVTGLSLVSLVVLYMVSVPVRTPPWRHLPGAAVAVVIWLLGSVALRAYLDASFGQVTIYGSLSAPIAVLAWFWVTAMAVLVGSSLNSEIDAMWPTAGTAAARAQLAAEEQARLTRLVERREAAVRSLAEREASLVKVPGAAGAQGADKEEGGQGGERDDSQPGPQGSRVGDHADQRREGEEPGPRQPGDDGDAVAAAHPGDVASRGEREREEGGDTEAGQPEADDGGHLVRRQQGDPEPSGRE